MVDSSVPRCRRRLSFDQTLRERRMTQKFPLIKLLAAVSNESRKSFGIVIPVKAPWLFVRHHVVQLMRTEGFPEEIINVIYAKM